MEKRAESSFTQFLFLSIIEYNFELLILFEDLITKKIKDKYKVLYEKTEELVKITFQPKITINESWSMPHPYVSGIVISAVYTHRGFGNNTSNGSLLRHETSHVNSGGVAY